VAVTLRETAAAVLVVVLALASEAVTGAVSEAGAPVPPQGAHAAKAGRAAWGAARWGMSVDEVLRAFPGEAVKLDPEERLSDGNVVAVGIERRAVAGQAFRVRFVFEKGQLALVSLRTLPQGYAEPEVYERMEAHLSETLGPPVARDRDDNFIDLRQTRWRLPDAGVDLKYIPGVVVVLYHPGEAQQADAGAP
jgi:hypothetical protein